MCPNNMLEKNISQSLWVSSIKLKLRDCGTVFDVDLSAETFDSLTNLD